MFNRNQLVHLIIWPNGKTAHVDLISPDGEAVARIKCEEPMRGDALSKMLPADFSIDPVNCTTVTLSGDIKVTTVAEFDTAIVTERSRPTMEERFERLERRERRREQREKAQAEANAKLAEENKRLKEEQVSAQVIADAVSDEPADEQGAEPVSGEAQADE